MIRAIYRNRFLSIAVIISTLLILGAGIFSSPHTANSQGVTTPITGYAWSDNIGWISLNCTTDTNGCATPAGNWGLSASNGAITGQAWSDNIGWIVAYTSSSGCPSGSCPATITSTGPNTYALSGWLQAVSADNKGWDGWISLSGTSPSYGVTANSCSLTGDAWGSDVVGWVDFSQANINNTIPDQPTCTQPDGSGVYHNIHDVHTSPSCVVTQSDTPCPSPQYCVTGDLYCHYPTPAAVAQLTVSPSILQSGATTTVTWSISNVQSCTVSGSNNDGTAASTDTNSPGFWSGLTGTETSSGITQPTTYTLSCVQDDPAQPPFVETANVTLAPAFQER
jgi:hypothetical protein